MNRTNKTQRMAWLLITAFWITAGPAPGQEQVRAPIEAVVTVDMFSAATQGNLEMLQMLLSYARGAINRTNEIGDTPLHCGVKGAHLEVVQYLLDNGANVNAINAKGNTPLDCAPVDIRFQGLNAAESTESPIAALLKSRGAKYHSQLEPPPPPPLSLPANSPPVP